MKTQGSAIRYTVIGLLALAALICGIFVSKHMSSGPKVNPNTFHGTWLNTPRSVNPFELSRTDGTVFNNESLKGQWTLVFFGFTNCGYLCPTTMAELAKTYRLLAAKDVKPMPRVVMVSIDPARDSIEKMDSYVHAFDPHFYGARGEAAVVEHMTREMGIVYARISSPEGKDSDNYDIQHSGAIMVFNPKGELNAFFTTPHQAEEMARDYRAMLG